MAITAQAYAAHDGLRNLRFRCLGLSDGTEQETNVTKIDMASLSPSFQARPVSVKVDKVTWSIIGPGTVTLAWDATPSPVPFAYLGAGTSGPICFKGIDGLPNEADTPNGNIVLSTTGFENGSAYTVELEMTKKY